ncbi:MAG: Tat pathway signal protein [Puia sp.]|nr:Tat pathway signal protein [Puia sp.]
MGNSSGNSSGISSGISSGNSSNNPWYRGVTRWGQVNITEKDPAQYDISWWRSYWKRTETRGVIVNAGGIVAYYPTRIPLHRKAAYLNGRDLFGDLCRAAHDDGLAVFARMDSNRAHEDFYRAHPDWFAIDVNGKPYKAGDLYVSCINGPYYNEHIPAVLREIAGLYHPEGFTDNSWSGLGRDSICYCINCSRSFHNKTGHAIPRVKNWDDPAYRAWIGWSYERRLELWDQNNRVTKSAGGEHCIWSGMNSGSIGEQGRSFRDFNKICQRAEIIMLDDQARSDAGGFQHNGEIGKLIHGILGWDKLVPESMAMYQAHDPWFRLACKPEPEARMWMIEGIAGGIQPWWHMVAAYHEDRRMYHNPEKIFRWHREHEPFLVDRQPVARVGIVWSQTNMDFYGRDHADELVELPWRGMAQAMIRGRIPYLPVHADHIDRMAAELSVLVLPNLAAMTDDQVAAVRRFVEGGGNLVATGETSLFDEWGDRRVDYALGDLFGAHIAGGRDAGTHDAGSHDAVGQDAGAHDAGTGAGVAAGRFARSRGKEPEKMAGDVYHTYLRLSPELRARVDGPHKADEPAVVDAGGRLATRHPILSGFEETDILPFGGMLRPLQIGEGAEVLLTFIPQFPVYPPEKAWMREPKTDIPALVLNPGGRETSQRQRRAGSDRAVKKTGERGSVVFLPADIDRQFGRSNLPDHGNLLKNIVRWAAGEEMPVTVEGAGLVDCHLYRQTDRLVLHLVNLTSTATWRQPLDEFIAIGPLKIGVRLPEGIGGKDLLGLVSGDSFPGAVSGGWSYFEVGKIVDHEVVVIE